MHLDEAMKEETKKLDLKNKEQKELIVDEMQLKAKSKKNALQEEEENEVKKLQELQKSTVDKVKIQGLVYVLGGVMWGGGDTVVHGIVIQPLGEFGGSGNLKVYYKPIYDIHWEKSSYKKVSWKTVPANW